MTNGAITSEITGYELVNETTGQVLARRAQIAQTVWDRLVGLIGRPRVPPDFALGIPQCDWVHTMGVLAALDIVYCERDGSVVLIAPQVMPWRFAPRAPGAFWSYEMAAGCLAPHVHTGDRLLLRGAERRLV